MRVSLTDEDYEILHRHVMFSKNNEKIIFPYLRNITCEDNDWRLVRKLTALSDMPPTVKLTLLALTELRS